MRLDQLAPIPGAQPTLAARPTGCAFHPRCFLSQGREPCQNQITPLASVESGQSAACHFVSETA